MTIVGPGGIGKTAVAISSASRVTESERGVRFVNLASIQDPALVATRIAAALGSEGSVVDLASYVLSHLVEKQRLLVLDNCEHLAEEAAKIAEAILKGRLKFGQTELARSLLDPMIHRVREREDYWLLPEILITGTSIGFGRDPAETLAKTGHRVLASMRDTSGKNRETATVLWARGADVVALDVTDDASAEKAVQGVLAKAEAITVPVRSGCRFGDRCQRSRHSVATCCLMRDA